MKNYLALFSLIGFLLFMSTDISAAVGPKKTKENVEQSDATKLSKKELRKQKRIAKKKAKLKKKIAKLKKKLERKAKKSGKSVVDLWNDGKFRLGILLLVAAIAVGLVALLISLGGLFSFIAGLLALAGVVFLVWSLVENYS